jgi:hypothetical protein
MLGPVSVFTTQGIETRIYITVMHRYVVAAERTAECMQSEDRRLIAKRAGLFPMFCHQEVHYHQDGAGMSKDGNEGRAKDFHGSSVPGTTAISRSQISVTELDSNIKLVSWTHNANFLAKPVQDLKNAGVQQVHHSVLQGRYFSVDT